MAKQKQNLAEKAQESQAELKDTSAIVNGKDQETIPMKFDTDVAVLTQLANDFGKLTVTRDPKIFEEGKKARKLIRDHRYDIQNQLKLKKGILNGVKTKLEQRADELIKIILPAEEHIHGQIKKIEAEIEEEKRIEREKAEKEKEQLRVQSVQYIDNYKMRIRDAKTPTDLDKIRKELQNVVVPDFGEFTRNASLSVTFLVDNDIPERESQIANEIELERLRQEQAAKDKELEELRKKMAEQEANEQPKEEVPVKQTKFVNKEMEKAIDEHDSMFWLEEYCNEIPQFKSSERFDSGSKEYILIETVNAKLKEVKDYMLSEIEKLYPGK